MPLPVRWKQVKDPRGHWYDAKIVGERGEGEEREVKVHYHGWKQSLDEWILASSDRILDEDEELPEEAHDWGTERGHIDEDQWEVEAIVKRRRKNNKDGCFVRWAGLNKEGEAWAPSWVALEDVCPELLDEFENPPEVPALPFVEKVSATIAPEIADSLVVEWRDDIGRQAAKLLARQRDEFACRRRALTLRPNNTAVMLVPPLEFKFRTRRQEGTGKWPTELPPSWSSPATSCAWLTVRARRGRAGRSTTTGPSTAQRISMPTSSPWRTRCARSAASARWCLRAC